MDVRDIFNFGVPTAILLMLMYGLWKMAMWFKESVVEPVVKSHLKLIETLNEHIPKQTEAIYRQSEVLEKRTALFAALAENQKQIAETAQDTADEIKRINRERENDAT